MKRITVLSLIILLCCVLTSSLMSERRVKHRKRMNESVTYKEVENLEKRYWLSGFRKEVSGETLIYHSPQPDVKSSLLVRSLKRDRFIEWETEVIPEEYPDDFITFIWLFGIDVNPESHSFDLYINNKKWFAFSNPRDIRQKRWSIRGKKGTELEFRTTLIDKYDDFMGYAFLRVPKEEFQPGRPLLIRVEGESAGSRAWYMTFKHHVEPRISLFSEQAILRKAKNPHQTIRAEIVHIGKPVKAMIQAEGKKTESELKMGFNVIRFSAPAVKAEKDLTVEFKIGSQPAKRKTLRLKPIKKKKIYLLHHSHVDIGYTHVQTEVEQIQWKNLEQAVELAEATNSYPEEAQFKWNSEVMWHVDGYMKKASVEKRKKLINAIKKGWIGLDGLYANELTGLCRPEELIELLKCAREAPEMFGVKVNAAMITDIPGYSWGLVPALAQSGIKYLSIGTNSGHRIGHILSEWADRPFYWVSPSGQEKVLCWVHGKGYSWFHTGLGYSRLKSRLQEKPIFEYLSDLEAAHYPYDIVSFRYNIGSDNGPPDPEISSIVKKWNEKYVSPELIISTTSELFRSFEQKYGDSIPAVRGDFTGHWEDGAASSARETALNRKAAERLVQAEVLWSILNPQAFPEAAFSEAWCNVILFDEHTWGSWNSISDPEGDFTLQQWKIKKAFAEEADRQSRQLLDAALKRQIKEKQKEKITALDIYNTNSWPRTDIVFIPKELKVPGDLVKDKDGNPIPSQRLSTGELAVLVRDIPPLGAKRLYFEKKAVIFSGKAKAWRTTLDNGLITVGIDKTTGAIASLKVHGREASLVNRTGGLGLNDYFYVAGRNPSNPQRNRKITIAVKENGPLVASLVVQSEAPGCRSLKREIRLIDGLKRLDIINCIDKKWILSQEGVHLAFPFHIPGSQMHMDVAWGVFRPEYDQLSGSCKNYFTVQRWIDISNQKYGVTWAPIDAPIVEVGGITADPTVVGWKKKVEPSQILFSYVMNNYWETNYKAAQKGPTVFRYSIMPHARFNPGEAEQFGIECSQPLIASPAESESPILQSFLKIEPAGVIVTSIKPSKDRKALMVRLFNASGRPEQVKIHWGNKPPRAIYLSSLFEEQGAKIEETFSFPAYGIVTLRTEDWN